ncbi:MAG TPA: hypothetical protein EYN06_05640 [Myxococcales bacterium]|nr:hypothetical protein [Myxococcales bacterium]HIN85945.1 hypothetical protein [Myxococcales bacterium]
MKVSVMRRRRWVLLAVLIICGCSKFYSPKSDTQPTINASDTVTDSSDSNGTNTGPGLGQNCTQSQNCDSTICVSGPEGSICSQSCVGGCPAGWLCTSVMTTESKNLLACIPNPDKCLCDGKSCGDNGCGSTCGPGCAGNKTCSNGQCICVPQCNDKQCGPDGCGNNCGSCKSNEFCNSSEQCVCTPNCNNKNCGPNGCGGSCGTGCSNNEICDINGQCVCIPNCTNKECGSDGCSDSCGKGCAANEICTSAGVCECVPDCANKQCGNNGCGGNCGSCKIGESCTADQCVCVPNCVGKKCGPNGCGGSCGSCKLNQTCSNNKCVCVPNCTGKVCGSDGCSGTCAPDNCPTNQSCSFGQCVCIDPCGKEGDQECQGNDLYICIEDSSGCLNLEFLFSCTNCPGNCFNIPF